MAHVYQNTPLYYAGIIRDLLVQFGTLPFDTSTQLLTYAQINEIIETIPNYYAGIMRDLPMLFGIPFFVGPTRIRIKRIPLL